MTNTERIRVLIGDTASPNVLSDAIIDDLYVQAGSVYGAAALGLRSIIAIKSISGKRVTAGDYSEDNSAFIKILSDMAERFESLDMDTPADSQAEVVVDDFSYRNIMQNKVLRGEDINE